MLGDAGNGVSCDKSTSSHPETIKYVKSEHFRFLTWHFLFMLHFEQRFFILIDNSDVHWMMICKEISNGSTIYKSVLEYARDLLDFSRTVN